MTGCRGEGLICASSHLSDLPAVDVLPVEVGNVAGVELGVALSPGRGHVPDLGHGGSGHVGLHSSPQAGGDHTEHGGSGKDTNVSHFSIG